MKFQVHWMNLLQQIRRADDTARRRRERETRLRAQIAEAQAEFRAHARAQQAAVPAGFSAAERDRALTGPQEPPAGRAPQAGKFPALVAETPKKPASPP